MSYEARTIGDWEGQKEDILYYLAKLETMNWAADPKIAESMFPYVLVEAINILKNSVIIDSPIDYTDTGSKAKSMISEITERK